MKTPYAAVALATFFLTTPALAGTEYETCSGRLLTRAWNGDLVCIGAQYGGGSPGGAPSTPHTVTVSRPTPPTPPTPPSDSCGPKGDGEGHGHEGHHGHEGGEGRHHGHEGHDGPSVD